MENAIPNVTISLELSLYPQKQETFDTVIIDLPKGRKLSRRWLLEAYLGLKQAGILLLAGANDQGIQSVVKDAANLFNVINCCIKKGKSLDTFHWKKNRADLPAWCDVPGSFREAGCVLTQQSKIKPTISRHYQVFLLPMGWTQERLCCLATWGF